jgi:hypothetical protein
MLHTKPTERKFFSYEDRIMAGNPLPRTCQDTIPLFRSDANQKGTAIRFKTWGEASSFYNWLLIHSNIDADKDGNRVWIHATGKQVKGLLADYRGEKGV